jgi:hypothetical protein
MAMSALSSRFEALMVILRALDFHKIALTWNFNRWFVALGTQVFRSHAGATVHWDSRRDSGSFALSSRLYFPLISGKRELDPSEVPDLIVVPQHGRFGNNIRQILYALVVAKRLGVREVVAKSLPQFPAGSWELSEGLTLTHDSLLRPRVVTRPRVVLGGDFFVVPRLPTSIENFDYTELAEGLARASGLVPKEPLGDDTLVIHIRSGDVFRESPHPSMGQPPLSFYTKVLSAARPTAVILVYEDKANPVIAQLETSLREQATPFTVHSGDLRSDLTVLLGAQQLVTGNGTFGQAVITLATHLRTWYYFGQDRPRFPVARDFQLVSIRDRDGSYSTALSPWRNTAEQRALMVSFPESGLVRAKAKR